MEHWEIKVGNIDSTDFFRLLHEIIKDATTIYFEGTSIDDDVSTCYKTYAEDGEYIPETQTIAPKSEKFRCAYSSKLLDKLVELSLKHAEPELFDHFSIYSGQTPLLEWPDAFSNTLLISKNIPENVISDLSVKLNASYS